MKYNNIIIRKAKKWLRKKRNMRLLHLAAVAALTVLFYTTMNSNRVAVDTKTTRPLLDLIADAESNGNYNAYFGNASSQSPKFTEMSIREVQEWQSQYVASGSPSSAVGRYQFLDSTLAGLVTELGIHNDQKFDETTQDILAVKLVERRGVSDYINNELSAKQFAANLSKEWASLPSVVGKNPSKSHYDGDGLNESRVSIENVSQAINQIEPATN